MDKIIDINSKLPKDTTIAVLDKADNQLRAFLSTETTETRYCFTLGKRAPLNTKK